MAFAPYMLEFFNEAKLKKFCAYEMLNLYVFHVLSMKISSCCFLICILFDAYFFLKATLVYIESYDFLNKNVKKGVIFQENYSRHGIIVASYNEIPTKKVRQNNKED